MGEHKVVELVTVSHNQKGNVSSLSFFHDIYIKKKMKKILITQKQLSTLVGEIKESDSNKLVKEKLYTIYTLAQKMWEEMGDDETLEDWMENKINQCEQDMISIVQTYLHGEDGDLKGGQKLDFNELIIGN